MTMPDTLPFVAPAARRVGLPPTPPPVAPIVQRPDVAVAALPMLARLAAQLRLAARFRDRCQLIERASHAKRWGVPALFFFDAPPGKRRAGPPPRFPGPYAADAADADPEAARAWHGLPRLLDDARTVLGGCVEARHAARATPGLPEAVRALASDHAAVQELADVLNVVDDEVVRVMVPSACVAFRVLVRGVADFERFEALLSDTIRGLLPAPLQAGVQCCHPDALRDDGALPAGFAASDHWFWGHQPLTRAPRVRGERLVLLVEPTVRTTAGEERGTPRVAAAVELIEVLGGRATEERRRAA